jgi:hypothetical protein
LNSVAWPFSGHAQADTRQLSLMLRAFGSVLAGSWFATTTTVLAAFTLVILFQRMFKGRYNVSFI